MKSLFLVLLLTFSHIIASNASNLDLQEHSNDKETDELSEDEISKIATDSAAAVVVMARGGSSSSSRSYSGSSSSSRGYGGSSRGYRGRSGGYGRRGRRGGLYGAAGGAALGAEAGHHYNNNARAPGLYDYQQGSATPTAHLGLTLSILIVVGIYVILSLQLPTSN